MQIAVLGLNRIGLIIVEKLLDAGHEVVVWNNSNDVLDRMRIEKAEFVVSQKLTVVHALDELQNILRKPRVIMTSMLPGEPTETLLMQISPLVEAGDIVIDSADSNFKDTQRRFEAFEKRGVKFLGIGLAGGIHARDNGFSIMIGGNPDGFQYILPLLDSLSDPNGTYSYMGTGGAGHFVKMIHNGIENGMSQVIAEGMGVLSKSAYQLDLLDCVDAWQEGSIISSYLLDMALDALEKDPTLSQLDGNCDQTLIAKGTVEQAKVENLSVPAIQQALDFQTRAGFDQTVQSTFTAKLIQAMRREWNGQDENKPKEGVI